MCNDYSVSRAWRFLKDFVYNSHATPTFCLSFVLSLLSVTFTSWNHDILCSKIAPTLIVSYEKSDTDEMSIEFIFIKNRLWQGNFSF